MTNEIKFYQTEDEAIEASKRYNRVGNEIMVVVEGPEDDWAVMPLEEAIVLEFLYSWYV